jgi:hypothetical protein
MDSVLERTFSLSHPESEESNSVLPDIGLEHRDWALELDVDDEVSMLLAFSDDPLNFEDYESIGGCQEFANSEQLLESWPTENHPIFESTVDIVPGPSLSDIHLMLPNSMRLSRTGHEALRHYQTTYSLYRTTKDPNWSTHKVLLHIGAQNAMIMNFILAVSLNDYSLRTGQISPSLEAEGHFQEGARLFTHTLTTASSSVDDVLMMSAYFFIYLYMSKRKSTAPHQLSQLSSTVLKYVQKRDLVTYCISALPLSDMTLEQSISSRHKRSLIARLVMWTMDEDVKCSFQGIGGHFARYLTNRDARTKDIYYASRNALGDYWGERLYPHSQALDDDQNSTVLEFLWAMMSLWQDINDLYGILEPSEQKSRIEQKFLLLEEVRVCHPPTL